MPMLRTLVPIGALLTGGCATVSVRRRPRVTIIPTGNELVQLDELGDTVPPGRIIESNSAVLAALAAVSLGARWP